MATKVATKTARRMMIGAMIGMALLLGALGFSQGASAQTFQNGRVSVSQHEYVGICKSLGGTPSRAGSRQVTCDMGGGYSSTCNFKTNTCSDTIPDRIVPGAGSPLLDAGVIVDAQATGSLRIAQPDRVDTAGAVSPIRALDADDDL